MGYWVNLTTEKCCWPMESAQEVLGYDTTCLSTPDAQALDCVNTGRLVSTVDEVEVHRHYR